MRSHPMHRLFATLALGCFGLLAAVSGAQAGIILAGGDPSFGFPSFGQKFVVPGGPGANFLSINPPPGGLKEPRAIAYGPNGNIFVLEGEDSDGAGGEQALPIVYQYSAQGTYIGVFIGRGIYGSGPNTVDLSTNNFPDFSTMLFGPDGNLYIAAYEFDETLAPFPTYSSRGMVLRFNGTTGAFIDIFIANGAGDGGDNRVGEPYSLAFDPAGNLYVGFSGSDGNGVLQFDSSGAYKRVVIDVGDAALDEASALAFHNGKLYVGNQDNDNVLQVSFNGDGSVNTISEFIAAGAGGLEEPLAMKFGPDGLLYVVSSDNGAVYRYNGTTGAFADTYVTPNVDDAPHYDPYGFIFFFKEENIPSLSQWGMIALSVLLLAFAAVMLRRRYQRPAV